MLSFIIPAHNEEALLGETLRVLRASAERLGEAFEIIVVSDASTDGTAEVARADGAAVLVANHRQIAAARNAGARVARGDPLVFIDADTLVYYETLFAALIEIRRGAVGGGARMTVPRAAPLWLRVTVSLISAYMRMAGWAAGCFLFARRADFDAVGGFDERYFATEEIVLSRALKRRGRMAIVSVPVVTSGRKAELYRAREFPRLLLRVAFGGRKILQSRKALHIWYDGKR